MTRLLKRSRPRTAPAQFDSNLDHMATRDETPTSANFSATHFTLPGVSRKPAQRLFSESVQICANPFRRYSGLIPAQNHSKSSPNHYRTPSVTPPLSSDHFEVDDGHRSSGTKPLLRPTNHSFHPPQSLRSASESPNDPHSFHYLDSPFSPTSHLRLRSLILTPILLLSSLTSSTSIASTYDNF